MAACSSLQVILRVEVSVHENDRVSSCKVQAHSPCKDSLLGSQNHIAWESYSCSFKNYTQKVTIRARKLGFCLFIFTLCITPAKRSCWPYLHPECHPVAALISQSSLSYFSEPCCTFTYTEKLASAADKKKKKKGCKITTSHHKLTLYQNIRKNSINTTSLIH